MENGDNLLQKFCRHTGLTRPMLRKLTQMDESDVEAATAERGIVSDISRLFRLFEVRFTIALSRPARFTFPVAVVARQIKNAAWREKHDLLRWPKDQAQRNRMVFNMIRDRSAAEVAAILNSQLIPGPENHWSQKSVSKIVNKESVGFYDRDDKEYARHVVNRELSYAFASPKLPEFVKIDTSDDPITLSILPCPLPVFRWLTSAAIAIEGFELLDQHREDSDAGESKQRVDISSGS